MKTYLTLYMTTTNVIQIDCKKFKETNKGIGGMDKVVCNQRGINFTVNKCCHLLNLHKI